MSSPMVVESVRTIPLVVEHSYTPMDLEDNENETGFPFDRDLDRSRRDDSFRSELDDLAKRHPEIAEHFEGFPFRSDAGSSGGGSTRSSRAANDPRFGRFTGRPFGSSRFERFGFPFTRDIFEDDFPRTEQQQREHEEQQQSHNQQPPQKQQEQQQEPPQQQHVPHNQKEEGEGVAGTSSKPPETPGRSRKPNIQQSNTVDLGQKQEPVNDRNQRSMSAPPSENRSGQQRFVSSIHIPVNREGGMGDMGGQQSQTQSPPPQPQQKQEVPSSKPMERVIPIHVEGRDEPVMPKHAGPSFSSHPQQPQQQYHQEKQQQHHPQSERIFGHMPSHFSQFVNREPQGRHFGAGPEWHHPAYERFATSPEEPMRQQQHQYQNQQQPKPHPQQPQQQQQQRKASPPPPPQSQKPQEEPPAPPQQPTPKPSTNPIDVIQLIQKDVSALMGQVEKFDGQPRDKQYLYLDEMLTRNLIKLDNIDTQGQENIRQARKEAIKCIEGCIGILEAKAAANVPQQPKGEANTTTEVAETKADEPVAPKAEQESMDIEPGEKPTMEAQLVEANVEQQPPAAKEATPAEQQEVKQSNETSTQPNENETNKSTEENAEQITEDKKEKKKGKQKKATKV